VHQKTQCDKAEQCKQIAQTHEALQSAFDGELKRSRKREVDRGDRCDPSPVINTETRWQFRT